MWGVAILLLDYSFVEKNVKSDHHATFLPLRRLLSMHATLRNARHFFILPFHLRPGRTNTNPAKKMRCILETRPQ
jgi:hypothetical protein